MDDEVETFRVVGVAEDGEGRLGAFVVGVDLFDGCVEALFDACFEEVLLFGVIMAAAPCDQKNAQRLGGIGREERGSESGERGGSGKRDE